MFGIFAVGSPAQFASFGLFACFGMGLTDHLQGLRMQAQFFTSTFCIFVYVVSRKKNTLPASYLKTQVIHVIPNKIHRSGKFDQLRCVFGVNPEFQSLVHMEIWKSKMFFNLEIILVKDDNDNNTAINCGALRLYR